MDYQKAMRLDGKGFVVLGAGQGIGLATAQALAQLGASVLCVDRDEELAKKVAAEIGGHWAVADIVNEPETARVFDVAERLFGETYGGLIDIVGLGDIRPLLEFSEQAWDRQFNLVLRHAFFAIKHGARITHPAGASMVFVSSMAGIRNMLGQSVYGVAKAALNHLVSAAAIELGPRNIRVNAVAPGPTRTPRVAAVLGEERLAQWAQHLPLGRLCTPEDVASVVLFLSSPLARNVTGSIYTVDSGLTNVAAFPKLELGTELLTKGGAIKNPPL